MPNHFFNSDKNKAKAKVYLLPPLATAVRQDLDKGALLNPSIKLSPVPETEIHQDLDQDALLNPSIKLPPDSTPEPKWEAVEVNNKERKALLDVIADTLKKEKKNSADLANRIVTKFDGEKEAPVSINDYLYRFDNLVRPEESQFIAMKMYLDNFRQQTGMVFTELNAHRLIAASFLYAHKMSGNDDYLSNAYIAKVAGISTKEMNALEADFVINNNVTFDAVGETNYSKYETEFKKSANLYQTREALSMLPKIKK